MVEELISGKTRRVDVYMAKELTDSSLAKLTERERERDRERLQYDLYKRDSVDLKKKLDEERKNSKILVKASEVKPEWNGHGYTYIMVDQEIGFSNVRTMQSFIQDIPPGKHNLMHKHDCEAIIYILSGRGYSIIDDKKYEWETGDSICIPDNVFHQHFNSDQEKPARFYAVTNIPLMKHLGKFTMVDKEFSENAPWDTM